MGASDTLSRGDRPSQTPVWHCPTAGSRRWLSPVLQGGIPTAGSAANGVTGSHSLPPILYMATGPQYQTGVSSMGSFVLAQVTSIFTGTSISPDALSRQRSNHYAFRAGRNLPDKEFTATLGPLERAAAVYWGLNSKLRLR